MNKKKNHLIIGGTGRAGTSILVKYLEEIGLETHLSKSPGEWDETANAGLEDMPIGNNDLPYVIKTPWLYQVIDQAIQNKEINIDAVIIPMRDLEDAAMSRVVLEYQSIHKNSKSHADFIKTWDTAGTSTKGGVIYSLDPVDQARVLAVGFHELVEKLVKNEIPMVFLSFPKFIHEHEYLYKSLKSIIGSKVSKDESQRAHSNVVDEKQIRVGNKDSDNIDINIKAENTALKREIQELRNKSSAKTKKLEKLNETLEKTQKNKELLLEEVNKIRNSTSWRITKPLRILRKTIND